MTVTVHFGLPEGFAGLRPLDGPVERELAIQRLLDGAPPNTDRAAGHRRLTELTESLRAADILAIGCAPVAGATMSLTIGLQPAPDAAAVAGHLPDADVQTAELPGGTAACAVYTESTWCRAHAVVVDPASGLGVVLDAACDRIGDEFCQAVSAVLASVRVLA